MKLRIIIALVIMLLAAGQAAQSDIARASGLAQAGGPQLVLTVNTLFDDPEPGGDAGDGICDIFPLVAGHTCSLRAAIDELNAYGASTGATHQIHFSFSGATPYTIMPTSPLPWIQVPVVIDGTTVAGASCPTIAGDVATLHMVLDGSNAGLDANGLGVSSGTSGVMIKGLVIGNFSSNGISLSGDNHTIQCNLVGIGPDGVTAMPNDENGILTHGNNCTIGGLVHAHRNVISANEFNGIRLITGTGTVVEGNYIGSTADGLNRLHNIDGAIYISGDNNQIGGTLPLSGNVLAGGGASSFDYGIRINSGDQNKVWGNNIGVGEDGVTPLGFQGAGVNVGGDAIDNIIGGVGSGQANRIENNIRGGIRLYEILGNVPMGTVFRGNSITDNAGLGIDLGIAGVTPNDGVPDSDVGPNGLLNFPVLSNVQTDGANLFYTLSYEGQTGFFDYDLYLNDSCDPSGYGEGQTHVFASSFLTGGSGVTSFSDSFAQTGAAGKYLVATATLGSDGTSEFSACALVVDSTSFTINDASDLPDADTADSRCDTDTNAGNGDNCTLRAAIEQVNASGLSGIISIDFNIPGGPHTITLQGPLPAITHPILLDATTQPGASCPASNTPANIQITLNGNGGTTDGLILAAGSDRSTIKGLSIINFDGHGLRIDSHSNTVQCNVIGLENDGDTPNGNSKAGIRISGDNNQIGGSDTAFSNVISANSFYGVSLADTASGNSIMGNIIGLEATRQEARGNTLAGIRSFGGDNNAFGGASADLGNIIGGNGGAGIVLDTGSSSNDVLNNKIGVDVNGDPTVGNGAQGIVLTDADYNDIGAAFGGNGGNIISGNGLDGILLQSDSSNNQLIDNDIRSNNGQGVKLFNGDDNLIKRNSIQDNTGAGIQISDGAGDATGNKLSENGIYNNGGMGIDLGANGVVEINDAHDVDAGPNNLQNYPYLQLAADDLTVVGQFHSESNSDYTIEFFSSPTCDSSGNGEGQTFLGGYGVTTDGNGSVYFTALLNANVSVGDYITAIASNDITGDTSEFSICAQVEDALVITQVGDASDETPGDGTCDINAAAAGPDCTLRAAIEEVNALAAPTKTVYFAIEGSAVHTITPGAYLPNIVEKIVLDGVTYQAGAYCPDYPTSLLKIELDGSLIGGTTIDGLNFIGNSAGSTIKGLAIGNFSQSGLKLRRDGITVRCNYLGLRADGITPMPNQVAGLTILADDVTVGGPDDADRNIISGNGSHGVFIDGSSATRANTLIQNNYIGVDKPGLIAVANGGDGIRIDAGNNVTIKDSVISGNTGDGIGILNTDGGAITGNAIGLDADKVGPLPNKQGIVISDSSNLFIGGDVSLQLQNWISGNTYSGVRVNGGAVSANFIQGNIIGQDVNGDPAGNGVHGVMVNGADLITIGGDTADFGNVIADNVRSGIFATGIDTQFVLLRNNTIFDNGELGIDLNGNGVSANDAGDGDAGASQTQNFPDLFNASPSGSATEVIGKLDSLPTGTYIIDFYSNFNVDSSGYGEGETLIASMNLSNGDSQSFIFTVPLAVQLGESITAIATEVGSHQTSSEFSAAIEVIGCTPPATFDPDIAIAGGDVQLSWASPS